MEALMRVNVFWAEAFRGTLQANPQSTVLRRIVQDSFVESFAWLALPTRIAQELRAAFAS